MVAARVAPRSRAVAVALVLMMVLPAAVLLVPTAAAWTWDANGSQTLHVQILVPVAPGSPNYGAATNGSLLKVNDPFKVAVFGNVTQGTAEPCRDPAWTAVADLSAFLGPGNSAVVIGSSTATPALGQTKAAIQAISAAPHVVAPGSVPGTGNTGITATVTATCGSASVPGSTFPSSGAQASSNQVLLDNLLPTATVTLSPANAKVGDAFTLSVTSQPSDLRDYALAIGQFVTATDYSTSTVTASSIPATFGPFTLRDRGFNSPLGWLNLTDVHGNPNSVQFAAPGSYDARVPSAVTATLTTVPGPELDLAFTVPAVDADVARYLVEVTPPSGTPVELLCARNGDCQDGGWTAGSTATLRITNATYEAQSKSPALFTRTPYTVRVRGVDPAGNVGPSSIGQTATTPAEPIANVTVKLLTGKGGVGSTFQLNRDPHARDVTEIFVDFTRLTGSTLTFSGAQSPVLSVAETGEDSPFFFGESRYVGTPANAVGLAILRNETFTFPFYPFDARSPPAPGTFQVAAKPDVRVEVSFAASDADVVAYLLERKVKSNASWEAPIRLLPTGCASGACVFTLDAGHFTPNATYQFRVRGMDERDNLGPASAIGETRPTQNPLSVTMDAPASLIGNAFPLLSGGFSVSDPAVIPSEHITVALYDVDASVYWDGNAGTSPTRVALPVTIPGSSNRWESAALQTTAAQALTAGAYRIDVTIRHPTGAVPNDVKTLDFFLDKAAPVPNNEAANAFAAPLPKDGVQVGVTKLNYAVRFTDDHGLDRVEFILYRDTAPAFTQPSLDPDGRPVVVTCKQSTCVSSGLAGKVVGELTPPLDNAQLVTSYQGTASFSIDRAAVGNHVVRVKMYDRGGNAYTIDETGANDKPFKVLPRLRLIVDDVKRGNDLVLPAPFVDANGLRLAVLAGWDNKTAPTAESAPCDLNVCRVTAVEVYGRDRVGTGTSTGTLLQNIAFPDRGPNQFLKGVNGPLGTDEGHYYDYTPTNPIPIGNIPVDRLEVRVKAYVTMGGRQYAAWSHGTDAASAPGTWLRVPTTTTQPGLFFTNPADLTTVYLSGSAGRVFFNVTFEQIGLDAPATEAQVPRMAYNVTVLNDPANPANNGKIVLFDGASPSYVTPASAPFQSVNATWGKTSTGAPALPKGPKFYFNWSNAAALPRGEYLIQVHSSGTDVSRASASRYFAIETITPTVTLAGPAVKQAEVFPATDTGRYVRPYFNVTARVDHNLANLSASGLSATLLATNAAGGTRVIRQDNEDFRWTVRDFETLPGGTASYANLTIQLPGNATDGTRYELRVHAAVESQHTGKTPGGGNLGNVTGARPIEVDAVPPGSGVFLAATNQTGFNPADELVLKGFSEDRGSGVEVVEVRIYDKTNDRTYMWNQGGDANGGWTPGLVGSWLSSEPRQTFVSKKWVRDVTLAPASATVTEWSVRADVRPRYHDSALTLPNGTWEPLPLDRNTTYVIDVRAKDKLGAFAEPQSYEVRFDGWAPAITAPISIAAGDAWAEWQDKATKLQVGIQDNQCLRNVTLYGRAPSGRVLGPFDFARPAGLQCGRTTGNAAATWAIDLKDHPTATDEVGRIEYWVEAWDPAGNNVTGTRTVNLTVNDTVPAEVRFTRAEPPVVGVGQPMRVVAEVWENAGIHEVRAFLARINPDSSFTPIGEGLARPLVVSANGTGEYVVESADVNATNITVGDYLWTVRAVDNNRNLTCALPDGRLACNQRDVIVRVSLDAGMQILQDSPARAATTVNATPTFQFTVYDRNVTASGITLRAGNSSANLTTVAPTSVTDAVTGGLKAGVVVTYKPNLTEPTFAIQLEATSQGVTNRTAVLNYTVDAIAPVVNANVTGTVDVGGKTYAVPATRVNITTDGPATITYAVNDAATVSTYTTTLTPSLPAGTEGEWRLDYKATDAAGNVARGTLRYPYDAKEPVINVSKHGDDLLVTVTDTGVGVNQSTVRVFYKYGDASTFTALTLQKDTGNSYRGQLTGNSTASGLKYHFEAKDLLGNTGTKYSAAQPYVIDPEGPPANLDPTLQLTSPAANVGVRDEVELRWLAEDPEGEELTITIALRTPTRGDRLIQTAGPNNGSYVLDLRNAVAGTHTLIVTASDGEMTTQESVNFVVERGDLVEVITPPPVQVEKDRLLSFAVRVNPGAKTVASVTYTLTRDNETVASGGMKPSQGTYAASIVPDAPGRYAILVAVAYADGTSEPQKQVATFSVAGAEAPEARAGFPASLITLVVLALATIALAAYAAFVRWPR